MGEGKVQMKMKEGKPGYKGKIMEKEGSEEELAPKLQTGISNQCRADSVVSSKFHKVLAESEREMGRVCKMEKETVGQLCVGTLSLGLMQTNRKSSYYLYILAK